MPDVPDSVSCEYRAAIKRKLTGEKLKDSKAQVELQTLQKSLEGAIDDGADTVGKELAQ